MSTTLDTKVIQCGGEGRELEKRFGEGEKEWTL
jgi:hypothetical protein